MFNVGDVVVARRLSNFSDFGFFNGKKFLVTGVLSGPFITVSLLEEELKPRWKRMLPSGYGSFSAHKFELDVFLTAARNVKKGGGWW